VVLASPATEILVRVNFFAQRNPYGFIAGGKDTVMPDFSEAGRQDVQHVPSDKFRCRYSHGFFVIIPVVPPSKRHVAVIQP
jgi:hypothetical protein